MRKLWWILGGTAMCGVAVAMVGFLLARPGGLRVTEAPASLSSVSLAHTEFWTAVRDFDLESATRADHSPERRRFGLALQMVAKGNRSGAVREFRALRQHAEEARLRQESLEALKRLLRAMARWDELAELDPHGIEGEFYGQAEPQRVSFPHRPVRPRHSDRMVAGAAYPR